jgi:hypothetical protein
MFLVEERVGSSKIRGDLRLCGRAAETRSHEDGLHGLTKTGFQVLDMHDR